MSKQDELMLLKKEIELLKAEELDRYLNPHKHFDYYEWQKDIKYQENHIKTWGVYPNRIYFTCANQIGKTFTMMDMAHYYCTDKEFRKRQWGNNQPRVIWYVLPSLDHINDFFEEKWVPDVLSREKAKEEGPYAWKELKKGKDIKGIHFLSTNCKLVFVTMGSKVSAMQGRSVGAIIFDEEPDVRKLGELETRTASFNDPETGESNAILVFGFTATSAQDYFKKIFSYQDEEFLKHIPKDLLDEYFYDKEAKEYRTCTKQEEKDEIFQKSKQVYKRRISIFEAQKFISGRPGRYTEKRARQFINDQPSLRDKMVRAFGAFEKEDNGGLVFKHFRRDKHIIDGDKDNLDFYKASGILTAGIDYGSGSNHPGGYVVTWISDDRKKVRVIKMWRGEKGISTTAGDIIEKYIQDTAGMHIHFPFYDFSCADLREIYNRITGQSLHPAVKDKDGYGVVDLLLKHNMLIMLRYEDEPYADWAASEFENIDHGTKKKDRTDELTDCIRYSLAGVQHFFDLEELDAKDPKEQLKVEIKKRKSPEDYGVRSWENVKEDKDDYWEENWTSAELSDWEGYFND